jgi:hypothetical protein
MPVSILTSLMLWTAVLAPASPIEPVHAVNVDRTASRVVADPSIHSFCSWPGLGRCTWDWQDADTEVEETGDGDPEGLVSDALWLSPHLLCEGSFSPSRRNRDFLAQRTRSPILRC